MYKTAGFMDSIGRVFGGGGAKAMQAASAPAAVAANPLSKLPPDLLRKLENSRADALFHGNRAQGFRRSQDAYINNNVDSLMASMALSPERAKALQQNLGQSAMMLPRSRSDLRQAVNQFRNAQQEAAALTGLNRRDIMPLPNFGKL